MAGGSSKQYIGLVDLLCEGPIHGLVNGKNSVYINDVPFENSSLVGTFNQEQTSAFKQPTLSYTANATSINVSGVTLTDKDIGKFAHIEVESITGCNLTRSPISFYGVNENYLSLSGTGIDSDFNTLTDNLSYVKVKSSNGVSFYADAKYTSGTTVTLYVSSRNISNQLITSTGWTITLIKAVEVTGRTDSDTFTIDSAFHTSNLTDVDFFFSDAPATESTTTGLVNNISKFDGSTLQFRKGTLNQAPIQQVNSLSGGVTITGAGNARSLQQSTDASSTYGLTLYNTSGYPENQSFPTDVGNAALVIPSGSPAGGIGFGLSSSQAQQVSELNVRINYSALITHNNENGDKSSASAIYVFLLELKKPGESNWNDHITLFSNHGGEVVHTDQTTAPVSFDHIIGLDRFKPFDDFRITIVRLTRDSGGLPVRANGGTGGETDRGKFTVQAQSSIGGANLSATIKDKFSYPYTAHAAVSFSSKTYDSLPSRSYLLQGLKVQIPTSYTPREYTDDGVAVYEDYWNGEFKSEQLDNNTSVPLLYYTDNPAWVFYDIVTNNRYGAGEWIEPGFINKFALYRIAKYCDELVDDGNGGTEPRFRANLYLAKATEVYKVLKDMATIFTGMLYWLDGKLTAVQDVPSEPIYNFSKANVVDGVFNYESTGRKTRVNQVVVTWNDPSANYEPVPLIVEDREAIVKAGRIISQNSVAMGATSEGQALRYGRWKLWTAQNQKEVVSFKTGLQGAFIRPGDIINVQDRDRYGVDYSGLTSSTTSATASSVTLDRKLSNVANASKHKFSTIVDSYAAFYTGLNPVTIDGETYNKGDRIIGQVYLYDSDSDTYELDYITTEADASNAFLNSTGTTLQTEWKPYTYVLTKVVTLDNTGDVSVATIDTTVDSSIPEIERTNYSGDAPALGSLWVLQALDANDQNILGSKKEYRVLSIAQEDNKNTYSITAVEYYIEKYDAVDKDYALGVTPSNVFPTIEDPDEEVPAPDNIYVAIDSDSSKPGEEIIVTWGTPQETFLDILDTVQDRNYSFIDKYELYHNVPHIESPIVTSRLSYRFENLEDGLYTFRVRAVSRKQNYSDFVSTQYEVNDQYGTNVERIVGGLPKGIYANSQIRYSYDANSTNTEAVRFLELTSSGFSKAHALTDESSASSLALVDVGGLGSSENRRETEWYWLLLDGGTGLAYWDTDTLSNLPFYRKIGIGGWRGSSQINWSSLGTVNVPANSTKITGTNFNSNLKPRDIIAFENVGNLQALSINSVSSSSSYYKLSIAASATTITGSLINTGDKIRLENATFTGSGTDFNNKEYYVTVESGDSTIQLFKDAERTEAVTNSDISKTWDEGGVFRRIGVRAAKVVAVVSNTQAILDRSFETAITSTTGYRQTYRPDFKDDAVFGRVRWSTYNETDDINGYLVESFITLEPNILAGKSVVVTPSIEAIQYDTESDATISQTTTFTSLTATVTALGFSNPQFRLVSFTFPDGTEVDSTVLDATISDNFSDPDETGGFTKEFTINSDSSVAYSSTVNSTEYVGTPIIIKAEVREKNNVGINAFGTGDIIRIKDGAAGTQGRTVELSAEDYTIVYDEDGANPSFETTSGEDTQLTITSTSRNFTDPIFQINIDNTNYPSSTFSSWTAGTSQDGLVYATYINVPTAKPSYTSKVLEVRVAENPDAPNAYGGTTTPTISATDSISILYLQKGEGGVAISNSNASHAYATDENGEITTSTIPNSGTTIEVLLGGTRGTYVGGTGVSSGGFSGTLSEGEWYVQSVTSSTSEFSAGNITESNDIITIGEVAVNSNIGYGEDNETITWTLRVGTRSGTAVDLRTTQSLSKSRKGAAALGLFLTTDHQVFVKDVDNNLSPSNGITITANRLNIPTSQSISFSAVDQNNNSITLNTISGNSDAKKLTTSNFGSNTTSVTITASVEFPANSGTYYTDSESIELLRDGETGPGAVTVSLSNDNHTFTADNDGAISSSDFSGSGTDISVYEGATRLSYDGSGNTAGTWTVSRTDSSNVTSPSTFSSLGSTSPYDAQHGAITAFSSNTGTVTYSISGKVADGTAFTASKVKTLSKAGAGSNGDPGVDAKALFLTSNAQIFKKATDNTITPSSITFTANAQNLGSSPTINFSSSPTVTLTGSGSTRALSKENFGSNTSVTVTASTTVDSVTYTDSETIELLQDGATGADAITVSLSNDNHTFTADSDGAVSTYTGSGTDIAVYEGATKLSYDGSGTSNGTWTVTVSASGITAGGITDLGTDARFAAASGMADATNSATITFSISGKTAGGDSFTASKVQTFSKAEAGEQGASITGPSGDSIDVIFIRSASAPSTPAASSGTPSGWSTSVAGATGTALLWASVGTKAGAATNYTWQTPYQVEGTAVAEVAAYRKNSSAGASGGSYNFTTSTLTPPTSWSTSPPSLIDDGDTVYVIVGTASGGPKETSASITWSSAAVYAQKTDGVGEQGDPGPRSVFAYIYYQSSSTSAPTIPALSTFTPNFTNGSVSSSNSAWSTNTPTFVAGNTNKYWYFTFTATESGTYNNGYPSVTKNSSPSAGSGAIQGIGFTGLVTFSSANNIDGFNPIEWINDNGATTGTSNTTTIDGGLIRTNTIIANKLAFTPVTSVAGVTGSSISTAQLSSAGLSLTQDLGSLASQDTVDLVNDISGTLPTTSGGTGNSYSNLTQLASGIAATTAFGDLATLDSINAANPSGYITGLGDLATKNEANLDFIGLSSTVIQAGKITLGTSGVLFDNADSSHTVVQNAIILDTSGSANAIYIYDGNTLRVKLGKLS